MREVSCCCRQECSITKQRNDTWLRVTWNGNMRLAYCTFCCMRWYFTINGAECTDPGDTTEHTLIPLNTTLTHFDSYTATLTFFDTCLKHYSNLTHFDSF